MRIIITILMIVGFVYNSACQITDVSWKEIAVNKVGNTQKVRLIREDFKVSNIILAFGECDKQETDFVEASNGLVSLLGYDKTYFVCPEEKNATLGFRVATDDFIVILSDTLILQVSKSVEELLSIVDNKKTVAYDNADPVRFGTDYIGNIVLKISFIANGEKMFADALIGIAFEPNTMKIIEVSFSYLN
jgi:hypothetical protein